jgi:hypothetical protein
MRFFKEFVDQGGLLSHDQSLMLLHMLGGLLKHRKPRRLKLVQSAD